jgi:hypothetical protein
MVKEKGKKYFSTSTSNRSLRINVIDTHPIKQMLNTSPQCHFNSLFQMIENGLGAQIEL